MENDVVIAICNEALLESGQTNTITSLGENSHLADLCNRLWETTLDEAFTAYAWCFKKHRQQADLQITGSLNVYGYPTSCLRVLDMYIDAGYQIREKLARVGEDGEGRRKIYSPHIPLFVEYITGAAENNALSPWARRFLVLSMALKIEAANSTDNKNTLQLWQDCLNRAEEIDAGEDRAEETHDDRFINCRG